MSFEKLSSGALTLAVIVVTALLVRREFGEGNIEGKRAVVAGFEKNWQKLLLEGRSIGPESAPVTLVYFSEVECPFCREFEQRLAKIDSIFPQAINRRLIHFPLPSHRNALAGAYSLECSGQQGRFREMLAVVFSRQSHLDDVKWTELAGTAGVGDLTAFARCMDSDSTKATIKRAQRLGEEFKVKGTPTIVLNGWRINGLPPESTLVRIIGDVRGGRSPKG